MWPVTITVIGIVLSYKILKKIKSRTPPAPRVFNSNFITIGEKRTEVSIEQFNNYKNFQTASGNLSKLEDWQQTDFLKTWKAKLKNSSKRGNRLYEISGIIPKKKFMMLHYKDPSTQRHYLCFVPENIKTADKGMAWKFYLTEEEYDGMISEA